MELVQFVDFFDWDTLIVQTLGSTLSFSWVLCNGLFPCILKLSGSPVGILKRKNTGSISCLSNLGCTAVDAESLNVTCSLVGNTSAVASIFTVYGATLSIRNSHFSGCPCAAPGSAVQSSGSTVLIEQTHFLEIFSTDLGGSIYVSATNMSIMKSDFTSSNSDVGGGAIWASHYSNIEIYSTKFTNVQSTGFGGALGIEQSSLDLRESEFTNCSSGSGGYALFASLASSVMLDLVQLNCNSIASSPAFAVQGSSLAVSNSAFSGCSSFRDGTIISAESNSMISIEGTNFKDIHSYGSGGCIGLSTSKLSISFTKFLNVTSDGGGNAVWATLGSSIFMKSVTVSCSDRVLPNSAFKIQSSYFSAMNGSFFSCSSQTDGAILQSYDNSSAIIQYSHFQSVFSEGFGGAVSAYGSNLRILHSSFSFSSSIKGGGAVWSSSFQSCYGTNTTANTILHIDSCIFESCRTIGNGGAIFVSSDTGSLSEESLKVDILGTLFTKCNATGEGGAISLSGRIVLAFIDNVSVHGCFSDLSGGAVSIVDYSTAAVWNTRILQCSAAASGGALTVESGARLNMSDSLVFMCTSGAEGGALSVIDRGTLVLVGSFLEKNAALGLGGGALCLKNALFSIFNVTFTGNQASYGGGGAIFWQGNTFVGPQATCPVEYEASIEYCILGNASSNCAWSTCTLVDRFHHKQGNGQQNLQDFVQSQFSLSFSNNMAQYGSIIASDYKNLDILGVPDPAYPGFPMQLIVLKKDAYNQVISSDSTSVIQALQYLAGSTGPDPWVSFVGGTIGRLQQGAVSFSFGVKPFFSKIDFKSGFVSLKSQPFFYFSGTDLATDGSIVMQSSIVPVVFRESDSNGDDICPNGYILALDVDENLNGSAQCKLCPSGSYSVNPLASNPSSASSAPGCLNCPAGGNCVHGGSDVTFKFGNWTMANGMYVLIACPYGFQLVNSTTGTNHGTFAHDLQQCLKCPTGTYIINPNVGQCQTCPKGALCKSDLSCAFVYSPSFQCPTPGDSIVGDWVIADSSNIFALIGCPAGYSLESTSKVGSADLQMCKPCGVGQYIINPNTDDCQACPPGHFMNTSYLLLFSSCCRASDNFGFFVRVYRCNMS